MVKGELRVTVTSAAAATDGDPHHHGTNISHLLNPDI